MDELLDKLSRLNEAYASRIEYSMQLEEELRLTRKALLIACYKYGYALFEDEYVSEEDVQSHNIYNAYTRPKLIARNMLKIARTSEYDSQTNIALKYWESEVDHDN